jgi:hypothetical protein
MAVFLIAAGVRQGTFLGPDRPHRDTPTRTTAAPHEGDAAAVTVTARGQAASTNFIPYGGRNFARADRMAGA